MLGFRPLALALAVPLLAACRRDDRGNLGTATTAPAESVAPQRARPEFVRAPEGPDVRAIVASERAQAKAAGRAFVVYVGATWCEPCTRFHHAVERGELDATFPKLTLLEFDADRDKERLATAGYWSRMIPLFAPAAPDGAPLPEHIEGSIKGEGAVAEIVPRLTRLLERTAHD